MHITGFPQKLVNLCRMLKNEVQAKVETGKHLSSEFKVNKGFRQGDAVAPLLYNVVLDIAIRRSQVEIQGIISDKRSQIMAYYDVVIMGKITRFKRSIYITGRTNK